METEGTKAEAENEGGHGGEFFDRFVTTLPEEIDEGEANRRVKLREFMCQNPGPWDESIWLSGQPGIRVEISQDDTKYTVTCHFRGHHRERYIKYSDLE